jgi:sec-independent protein translocase protein TatA
MKIGTQELLIVLLVVLLIFGPTQLPKLFNIFGKSIKGLRKGMDESKEEAAEKAESKPVKESEAEAAEKTESASE